MKKLLLTLTMILSVMALSAQVFTVTEAETGNVVQNGASYFIYGEGNEWGEINMEFTITANDTTSIVGEKVEMNVVENTSNWFCWGVCLPSTEFVSRPNELYADASDVFSVHYMFEDGYTMFDVAGYEQVMQYYLYTTDDPDNKFVINVTFKYSLDDVEDINAVEEFSGAYPVPASDVVNFDYSFNSGVNSAMVAVYNMMGQEVLRSDVSGMSGKLSLNVSDLADGVYFYSLIVNGKTEKSSKLVVRH